MVVGRCEDGRDIGFADSGLGRESRGIGRVGSRVAGVGLGQGLGRCRRDDEGIRRIEPDMGIESAAWSWSSP